MLPENMCRTIGRRRVNFSSPQRNGQPQEAARPGLLWPNTDEDGPMGGVDATINHQGLFQP